jgi:hypothetical protein
MLQTQFGCAWEDEHNLMLRDPNHTLSTLMAAQECALAGNALLHWNQQYLVLDMLQIQVQVMQIAELLF